MPATNYSRNIDKDSCISLQIELMPVLKHLIESKPAMDLTALYCFACATSSHVQRLLGLGFT